VSAPIGLYVRVSRKGEREDDRFHSPREQAERAAALAVAKGYVVGPTFEDIDVSGAKHPTERPAMKELLAAVKRGELAGIAAFSLDRLSRDPAHGDELVRVVTKAGGVLLTPDIPDAIDSPTGEFTFGMLLQVARLYRSQAGARFASAKERATRAGIPVGQVPIGYRQRDDRTIELDPTTAPIVREVFERRAAGAGWGDLADFLAERTGRVWTKQGASAIVRRRIYATGRLEYGGVVSDVEVGVIVDEPLWHAAQRAESQPQARNGEASWLLTGLARCATCGHALAPWRGSARRRRDPRRGRMDWVDVPNPPRRYRCPNRACATRVSVDAPRLERLAVLQSFAAGDELVTRANAPDLGALEAAAATAEQRLAQVLAPEARDALGELWAADVKARRTERDDAMAALGAARRDAGVPAATLRLRETWDALSPLDRRAALALFWREVRVGPRDAQSRQSLTFVARGPRGEADVELPNE
jgi:DNA invertase Pin-like site-specific DNA recombinase